MLNPQVVKEVIQSVFVDGYNNPDPETMQYTEAFLYDKEIVKPILAFFKNLGEDELTRAITALKKGDKVFEEKNAISALMFAFLIGVVATVKAQRMQGESYAN